MGDPDFVPGQSTFENELIQRETADGVRAKISDNHTLPVDAYNPDHLDSITKLVHAREQSDDTLINIDCSHGTSHLSTTNASGMAVSLTSTPNLGWGSKLMIPGLGLIMNNEMDDFSVPNRSNHFGYQPSESNFIAPSKRPFVIHVSCYRGLSSARFIPPGHWRRWRVTYHFRGRVDAMEST